MNPLDVFGPHVFLGEPLLRSRPYGTLPEFPREPPGTARSLGPELTPNGGYTPCCPICEPDRSDNGKTDQDSTNGR